MSASRVNAAPRGGDLFEEEAEGATAAVGVTKNKWEGEDEEEDVLDSWDQEDEEEEKVESVAPPPEKSGKKNLKKLGDKFEEKERKKREQQRELDVAEMTPEERLADKLRRQQLQEESDLCLAKEVFGVTATSGKVLESKEDYDKLKDDLLKCLQDSTKNAHYVTFAEDLVQALCLHMTSLDIKRVHTKLGNIQIEKAKLEKGDKGKKGKGKAKIKIERDGDYSDFSSFANEEFDDFI